MGDSSNTSLLLQPFSFSQELMENFEDTEHFGFVQKEFEGKQRICWVNKRNELHPLSELVDQIFSFFQKKQSDISGILIPSVEAGKNLGSFIQRIKHWKREISHYEKASIPQISKIIQLWDNTQRISQALNQSTMGTSSSLSSDQLWNRFYSILFSPLDELYEEELKDLLSQINQTPLLLRTAKQSPSKLPPGSILITSQYGDSCQISHLRCLKAPWKELLTPFLTKKEEVYFYSAKSLISLRLLIDIIHSSHPISFSPTYFFICELADSYGSYIPDDYKKKKELAIEWLLDFYASQMGGILSQKVEHNMSLRLSLQFGDIKDPVFIDVSENPSDLIESLLKRNKDLLHLLLPPTINNPSSYIVNRQVLKILAPRVEALFKNTQSLSMDENSSSLGHHLLLFFQFLSHPQIWKSDLQRVQFASKFSPLAWASFLRTWKEWIHCAFELNCKALIHELGKEYVLSSSKVWETLHPPLPQEAAETRENLDRMLSVLTFWSHSLLFQPRHLEGAFSKNKKRKSLQFFQENQEKGFQLLIKTIRTLQNIYNKQQPEDEEEGVPLRNPLAKECSSLKEISETIGALSYSRSEPLRFHFQSWWYSFVLNNPWPWEELLEIGKCVFKEEKFLDLEYIAFLCQISPQVSFKDRLRVTSKLFSWAQKANKLMVSPYLLLEKDHSPTYLYKLFIERKSCKKLYFRFSRQLTGKLLDQIAVHLPLQKSLVLLGENKNGYQPKSREIPPTKNIRKLELHQMEIDFIPYHEGCKRLKLKSCHLENWDPAPSLDNLPQLTTLSIHHSLGEMSDKTMQVLIKWQAASPEKRILVLDNKRIPPREPPSTPPPSSKRRKVET